VAFDLRTDQTWLLNDAFKHFFMLGKAKIEPELPLRGSISCLQVIKETTQ